VKKTNSHSGGYDQHYLHL